MSLSCAVVNLSCASLASAIALSNKSSVLVSSLLSLASSVLLNIESSFSGKSSSSLTWPCGDRFGEDDVGNGDVVTSSENCRGDGGSIEESES